MGLDVSNKTQLYRGGRPHIGVIRFARLRFITVATTRAIRPWDGKPSRNEI
jgi:hypothetical protein